MATMLIVVCLTIAATFAAAIVDAKEVKKQFGQMKQEYNKNMELIHGYTANNYKI